MAEEGLTSAAIRGATRELGFKIDNESEADGFQAWDLMHEDLPAGVIMEIESTWMNRTGPPNGPWDNQFLKDLYLKLRLILEHKPSSSAKQRIIFAAPVSPRSGEAVYPVWLGPIEA